MLRLISDAEIERRIEKRARELNTQYVSYRFGDAEAIGFNRAVMKFAEAFTEGLADRNTRLWTQWEANPTDEIGNMLRYMDVAMREWCSFNRQIRKAAAE